MNCPHCHTNHSCGCAIKTASDGTRCCSSCHGSIEEAIRNRNSQPAVAQPSPNNYQGNGIIAPHINSVTPIYNNFNT